MVKQLINACITLAVLTGTASVFASAPSLKSIQGKTMGTTYSIKFVAGDKTNSELLKKAIDVKLELINDQMSTWRKNSELSKFNAFKKKTWFKVSHATANTVKKALKIGDLTHGAFDVTIGKVVNLWGFGPTKKPVKVPPKKVLQEALASNGYKKIEVRLTPPSLRKSNPNLYVDLSGIAKGYGVDIVAEHLESVSIHSYMVEIGGEMRLKGEKPGKQAWKIAIERPQVGTRAIHQILSPRNHGLATSGDYRNFFEDKGQRYSHLIDPRNGYPIKHRLVSVTVIADTSLEADAFATAFMVLGLNEGLAIAKKQKMAVMFLVRDGESFKDIHTTQFTQYMVK